MKIHEYQAKEVLRKFGVPTPRGVPSFSVEEAVAAGRALGGNVWVVKAQIHAGGRGKGGGVKLARSPEELRTHAAAILGMQLVTHQTGPAGQKVRRLFIEEGADIKREYYVGLVVDRGSQRVVLMASSEGGMDIEEVAQKSPEKIHKVAIDPFTGLTTAEAADIARKIGIPEASNAQAATLLQNLYRAFDETDASLVEVNPMILTGDGRVLALDAKMNFDDNALYRHPDLKELRDLAEEAPLEVEASKYSLNYIKLDGTIGCMVNGAGLAMATMDIIKLAGGEPANFLDVGGGANAEQIKNAFRILMSDTSVKAVLINIFGGILRCDVLAAGVIAAVKDLGVRVPIVIRMEGTNVEAGKQMLKESGLNFTTADGMGDAAEKVVKLASA